MHRVTLKFGAVTLLTAVAMGPLYAQTPTGPGKSTAPTVTSTGTDANTGRARPGATGTAGTSNDTTGTAVGPEGKPGTAARNTPDTSRMATSSTSAAQDRYDPSADARASKVIGSTVYNEQNETVGSLDDILIARDNKQPVRAVISVGGFLGIGNKLVEVDYNRLRFDQNNKVVLPNATKDDLTKMPGFTYRTASNTTGVNPNATINTAPVVPLGQPTTGTPETAGTVGPGPAPAPASKP
jgi:sporulation protein YlmC with PRC-barrel domain